MLHGPMRSWFLELRLVRLASAQDEQTLGEEVSRKWNPSAALAGTGSSPLYFLLGILRCTGKKLACAYMSVNYMASYQWHLQAM